MNGTSRKIAKSSLFVPVVVLSVGLILALARDSRSDVATKNPRVRDRDFKVDQAIIKMPSSSDSPAKQSPGMATGRVEGPWTYKRKRLLVSAAASDTVTYFYVNRTGGVSTSDGEIWLTLSDEEGIPFTKTEVADIKVQRLGDTSGAGAAYVDKESSRPQEGAFHIILPGLSAGNHFYRIAVSTIDGETETWSQGQTVTCAKYTRAPYWNSIRPDGTIWYPPK